MFYLLLQDEWIGVIGALLIVVITGLITLIEQRRKDCKDLFLKVNLLDKTLEVAIAKNDTSLKLEEILKEQKKFNRELIGAMSENRVALKTILQEVQKN